jgi:exopolysaccharide production protein ExoQ
VSAAAVAVRGRAEPALLLPGCVGFYLAARLCITYLFFQAEPQSGAMVSFALNFALVAATVFYSFGGGPGATRRTMRTAPFLWVLGFLAVGCCSLAWSATISKGIAFAYWSELAGQVAMMVLLLRTGPAERVAGSTMRGYVTGACVIALIAWLSPTMQDLRPGNDDFFSPNAIGFTCAFGIYQLQYLSRREGGWTGSGRVAAGLLAITLLRTLSKTTLAAFVVGQLFLLMRDKSMSRARKVSLSLVSLGVIALFWPLIAGYYAVYSNAGNQAETLTGRLGIWAFVLGRALEQPWLGHGFHSFRNVIPPFGSFEAWHAHNEVLQQFYTYGVLGIVLLIGIYWSLYRYTGRVSRSESRTVIASLLIFIVVRGLADTENFDLSLPLWFITLISLAMAEGAGSEVWTRADARRGATPGAAQGGALRGCAS